MNSTHFSRPGFKANDTSQAVNDLIVRSQKDAFMLRASRREENSP